MGPQNSIVSDIQSHLKKEAVIICLAEKMLTHWKKESPILFTLSFGLLLIKNKIKSIIDNLLFLCNCIMLIFTKVF